MSSKLTRAQIPFASGSYKKAYLTVPVNERNPNWLFNNIPNTSTIITSTNVGKQGEKSYNKQEFKTLFTEFEWLYEFNNVELAPKIYAISLENHQAYNVYYIYNGDYSVKEVYLAGITHFDLNSPITVYALTEKCVTSRVGDIIGDDQPIKGAAHLLELVTALIDKLVYHKTLFIDFKASNICVKTNPVMFTFLDFDPTYIIPFSEMNLPEDEVLKACKTYMLVMFVGLFIRSDAYGRTHHTDIQTLVRQNLLAKYDIMAMLNTFIKMEKTAAKLCLMEKNPLTMLFHYFENPLHSGANAVYYCDDIRQVTYSNGQPPLRALYNTLMSLVCGQGSYTDWLRASPTHVLHINDIENYKQRHLPIILPRYGRPLYAQTGAIFTQADELKLEFKAPPPPAEHDPEMMNEPLSMSANFGEKLGESLLEQWIPIKKSRKGGSKKRLRSRRNKFRVNKYII